MNFNEYLQFIKTLRMLYGHNIAKNCFEKNTVVLFPDVIDTNFFKDYAITNTSTKNIEKVKT